MWLTFWFIDKIKITKEGCCIEQKVLFSNWFSVQAVIKTRFISIEINKLELYPALALVTAFVGKITLKQCVNHFSPIYCCVIWSGSKPQTWSSKAWKAQLPTKPWPMTSNVWWKALSCWNVQSLATRLSRICKSQRYPYPGHRLSDQGSLLPVRFFLHNPPRKSASALDLSRHLHFSRIADAER